MKAICTVLSICFMFWTIPASAQSIQSDYDSSYDLSKLKSYDFAPHNQRIQATLKQNSLNDKRIKEALESQLNANGFTKSEAGKADFTISYRIGSRPTTRTVTRSLPAVRRGGGGTIEVPQCESVSEPDVHILEIVFACAPDANVHESVFDVCQ